MISQEPKTVEATGHSAPATSCTAAAVTALKELVVSVGYLLFL